MTIQAFNIYTANGYEGELVDSGPRVTQTGVLTSSKVGFGKALGRDNSVERGVAIATHSSGSIPVFAITQREYNHEASLRPSTGTDFFYKKTESVSLIRDGYLRLKVTGAAAVAGALALVHKTDGTFSGGSATGDFLATTNVVWEESGQVGDIIKARIILVAG